jgi:hypothetical protein
VIDKVTQWLNQNGLSAFDVGGDRAVYSITPADIAHALKIRKVSSVRTVLSRMRKATLPEVKPVAVQVVSPPHTEEIVEPEYVPLDQ